jgi:pyruvate/2-oxoglutarate dehydrogenase complex dihydrolipoamide acyltransferase (E2) component
VLYRVELPRLGDTTTVALITEWLCSLGSRVEAGSSLMVVETDKVAIEVPAPVAGTLVEYLVAIEEEVAVGAPICVIETSDT